jgi:uncharacterized RDD family membrane protein YckC
MALELKFKTPKLWRRMACFMYEGFILFGLGLIPGVVGAFFTAIFNLTSVEEVDLGLRVLSFWIYAAYFTWFWSQRGQTLPMQTWHIQVVTWEGKRLTHRQAFLRFLACWIWIAPSAILSWLIGLSLWQTVMAAMMGFGAYAGLSYLHPTKQFWHDALCGTQLIHKKDIQACLQDH